MDHYLEKWYIGSFSALFILLAVLFPIVAFTPHQLARGWKSYWFRPAPYLYLAVIRIVAVGTQLLIRWFDGGYSTGLRQLLRLANLPDSMFEPLPVLRLYLFPFGADARPAAWVLASVYCVTIFAGICGLLGLKTRPHLFLFALGNTFLQAFAFSFGDLHHREALMTVALWLLAFSPAGGALSVDNYLARRKSPPSRSLESASVFAAWPVLLIQQLVALVYLDAALRKLFAAGCDWVNGYTLQFYVYADASRRGSELGLWFAQQHGIASVFSWVTILWEGYVFRRPVSPAPCLGVHSARDRAPLRHGTIRSGLVPPVSCALCGLLPAALGARWTLTNRKNSDDLQLPSRPGSNFRRTSRLASGQRAMVRANHLEPSLEVVQLRRKDCVLGILGQ